MTPQIDVQLAVLLVVKKTQRSCNIQICYCLSACLWVLNYIQITDKISDPGRDSNRGPPSPLPMLKPGPRFSDHHCQINLLGRAQTNFLVSEQLIRVFADV